MNVLNRMCAIVLLSCSASLALADDMGMADDTMTHQGMSDDTMKHEGMSDAPMNQGMDDMKKDDMADDMGQGMKEGAMSDPGMDAMKKDTMSMDQGTMDITWHLCDLK